MAGFIVLIDLNKQVYDSSMQSRASIMPTGPTHWDHSTTPHHKLFALYVQDQIAPYYPKEYDCLSNDQVSALRQKSQDLTNHINAQDDAVDREQAPHSPNEITGRSNG
jgi:hypothetical protein